MGLNGSRASALCAIAVLATACGGAARSIHSTTTTRPLATASLEQPVTAGRLTFKLPSSWIVGSGVCRCGWGTPDTATLDNGPQEEGVSCNCPAELSGVPSGLHLYEGQSGLISGGSPMTINGLDVLVSLDTSNATLTATFPSIDQWMTISPAPSAATVTTDLQQVALERQILSTVSAAPSGNGA